MSEKLYELRWRGPCDMSGYGMACIGYAIGLSQAGIRVCLVDKSMSLNLSGKGMDDHIRQRLQQLQEVVIPKTAPVVQHQVGDQLRPTNTAAFNIGYTIFEMTRVPPHWVPICNAMDQIWTGSTYSKEAFVNSGLPESKVHVIPHIIDLERFNPSIVPLDLPRKAGYNFLSVFDFQERKAWRELLIAYVRAFSQKDDVCLWLKCYQHSFEKEDQVLLVAKLYQVIHELGIPNPPRIEVCPFDIPFSLMPRLYRSFDCYVSIAREGFGLPFAEAAASGLTVIGPERGGVREFLTKENSYLVDYVGDRPISLEMMKINPTFVALDWATHSVDHLQSLMKEVFENREDAKKRNELLVADIHQKLHYTVIADKVKKLLDT
jgi:glycosyltransferase involved in cell wall biosynthesis